MFNLSQSTLLIAHIGVPTLPSAKERLFAQDYDPPSGRAHMQRLANVGHKSLSSCFWLGHTASEFSMGSAATSVGTTPQFYLESLL